MRKNAITFPFWGAGDKEASIGLFFDSFSKVIISISLMLSLIHIPADIVFGRIVPGIGLSLFCGSMWYVKEAYSLYKKEQRTDITAQPFGSGLSTAWLFLIMLPVYIKTKDPLLAWQVGLAATFIGAIIEFLGAFFSSYILRYLPSQALLANMAAGAFIWLAFVSMTFIFQEPVIGGFSLIVIFLCWNNRFRLPFSLPPGLFAILLAGLFAWLMGKMSIANVKESLSHFGFYSPKLAIFDIMEGLKNVIPFLSVVIPLQIANFISTLQALKSASLAGDGYPVKLSMSADASWTLLGSLFGNPFPTTVYYGHAGWKKIHARSGYVFLTGILSLVICLTGTVALIDSIIPYEAVLPIMVFVGLIIASQAFEHVDKKYFPILFIAFFPFIGQYTQMILTSVFDVFSISLEQSASHNFYEEFAIPLDGIFALGNGAYLSSLLLAAFFISVFDRSIQKVAISGGLLFLSATFGFIHANQVGFWLKVAQPFAVLYLLSTLFAIFLIHINHNQTEIPYA